MADTSVSAGRATSASSAATVNVSIGPEQPESRSSLQARPLSDTNTSTGPFREKRSIISGRTRASSR